MPYILVITMFFLQSTIAFATTGDFETWLKEFRQDAAMQGISATTIESSLTDIHPLPRVIELDRNQPEFHKTLKQYLAGAVSEKRVQSGRKLLHQHGQLLNRIYRKFGVPPHYIVALWGIETSFGRHVGKMPIIASLATLSWEGRRSAFFRKELINALRIIDAGHISAEKMHGSWAGAMGQVQFMPSTFLRAAVDGNNDGRIDLWGTEADYLSSAANYLAKSGWKSKQLWGREVYLPQGFSKKYIGLKKTMTVTQWQKLGIRKVHGPNLPATGLKGSLVQPDGTGGRTFLVYNNYRTILKWNRSHKFAVAVGLLADRIRKE